MADYPIASPLSQQVLQLRRLAARYGHGSFKLLKRIAAATRVPLESFDRKDAA